MPRKTATGTIFAALAAGALALGCAQTHFNAASTRLENGDVAGALSELELGAEKGDRRCAYLLGSMLLSGQGVDPDLEAGVHWMRQAAEAQLPVAQTYLGMLYANGEGVEQDPTAAAEWYLKAANFGDPVGQAALGEATFYGIGVSENRVEGYKWTKLAADQGVEKAAARLEPMRAELSEEEWQEAEKLAARFEPSDGGEDVANWSGNRPRRASTNVRRGGEGRAFRSVGGY